MAYLSSFILMRTVQTQNEIKMKLGKMFDNSLEVSSEMTVDFAI